MRDRGPNFEEGLQRLQLAGGRAARRCPAPVNAGGAVRGRERKEGRKEEGGRAVFTVAAAAATAATTVVTLNSLASALLFEHARAARTSASTYTVTAAKREGQ